MKPAADHPLQLVLGFGAWLTWFVVAYGGLGVACSVAPPPPEAGPFTWINGVLLVLTLGTAAADPPRPERAVFIARAAAWLHGAAALSTLVVGLPMLALPACA